MVRTASEAGIGDLAERALPGVAASYQNIDLPHGNPAGRQLEQAGQALAQVGDAAYKIGVERDALTASALDEQYKRDVMAAAYVGEDAFFAQKGEAALTLPQTADAKLTEIRKKYSEQAQQAGPRVGELFNKTAGNTQIGMLESISKYTLSQQAEYKKDRAAATVKLGSDQIAFAPENDQDFQKYSSQMVRAAQIQNQGAAPEVIALATKEAESLAESSRAMTLMKSDDPNKIIKGSNYFKAAQDAGKLTLADVNRLEERQTAAVPRAMALTALPAIVHQSGDFNALSPERVFAQGIIPQESGGRRFAPDGGILTSSKGAKGEAQVLDSTNADPGYGVTPAKDNSPAERARVGQDYFKALVTKYGNNTLATMAYNAGPGAVDDFMAGTNDSGKNPQKTNLGDPRTSGTMDAFIAKFPFAETRDYVQAVQRRNGIGAGKIDLEAAYAKSQELEQTFPGAGQAFLTMVNKQNTEVEKIQAQQNATFNSDFNIALNRGEKTYADIEQAYGRGLITPEQRTGYVKQLDEVNHNTLKDKDGFERVNAALTGGAVLDPKRSEDKKAVDQNYRAWATNIIAANPEIDEPTLRNAQIDLIGKYGMVPESLQGNLRGMLRSENPKQKIAAADILDKIRQKNPALLNDFSEEDIKDAMHIQAYTQAGYAPDVAATMVQEQQKLNPEVRKVREDQFKEALKAQPVEGIIRSAFTSWNPFSGNWNNSTIIPGEMQNDYQRLAQAEFVRTGSMSTAQKVATTLLQKTWGPTQVGEFSPDDKEGRGFWMKNPPEKYYSAPVATMSAADQSAWMREQLLDEVNAANTLTEKKFKDGDLTLTVSPHTLPDGRPTYNVWYKRDGVIDMYGGDSFVWHPDWQGSEERKRMLEVAQQPPIPHHNVFEIAALMGQGLIVDPAEERKAFENMRRKGNR